MTNSNIEPLARDICARICARNGLNAEDTAVWVDRHWESAAAELEAGVIDETGRRIPGIGWEKGLEAFIERIKSEHK